MGKIVKVGLTGGIATGKSTVSRIAGNMGIPVIDTDQLAREVVEPGTKGLEMVVKHFGREVLNPDGTLNRKLLGAQVFKDHKKRELLESILHPLIKELLDSNVKRLEDAGHRLVLVEVPLLFEKGWDKNMDYTIVVYAPVELQVERLMKRDGLSREEVLARIKSQMPVEEKVKLADFVIENTGDIKELEERARKVLERLYEMAHENRNH